MSKIRVLSEHTINKIAAGEVIENPSSVVKELVENSIDSGATEIHIEIKLGGRQLIRVSDNGCGMDKDDALLCLERHATSKIKEVEDIHEISTMGFRGEAIPSIAAISKFTLITRQAKSDQLDGTMVIVDGGKLVTCSKAACAPGTTIEVKSLFFNVPVRKKFQRSPAYDANEILKMVSLLALANPEISFTLVHNQEIILSASNGFNTNCEQTNAERVKDVLGTSFFSLLLPIKGQKGEFSLSGFMGAPSETRQNRTGQYLFINKRAVTSHIISSTVKNSYGTTIPSQRHPVFVFYLTVPGDFVDVNVHPQKKEVRLRQEQILKDMIKESIEGELQKTGLSFLPDYTFYSEPINYQLHEASEPFFVKEDKEPYFFKQENYRSLDLEDALIIKEKYIPHESSYAKTMDLTPPSQPKLLPKVIASIPGYIIVDPHSIQSEDLKGDGLCIVDQHAAHYRVIFEKLLHAKDHLQEIQSLLIPYHLDLTPSEAVLLKNNLEILSQMGFQIKEFGPCSFLIEAIPQIFGNIDIQLLFLDIVHNIKENDDRSIFSREKEKMIAFSASKSAVNRGKKLSFEESIQLVNQLMNCKNPFYCPVGKPTIKLWNQQDLSKFFQK